jgi:hypothetical protein
MTIEDNKAGTAYQTPEGLRAEDAADARPPADEGLRAAIEATEALPEDAPVTFDRRSLYAEGWADRGDAIRAALAAQPAAYGAVQMLSAAVNRGGRQADVAEALGSEHGYLVNQIVYGIALGVIRKAWFAFSAEDIKSCGDVMYLLAVDPGETKEARSDHPYHDGELSCNAIRGALVTLGVYNDGSWRQPESWIWKEIS